ncbi:preprotein translocase subunit SecG [Bacteroidota bacterium]
MYIFIVGLIIVVCVVLILIILVQNSKGGGLASNFSGSNQIMGVRKTTDFLEKATWVLASALLILSVAASWVNLGDQENNRAVLQEQVNEVVNPSQMSSFPIDAPAENPTDNDNNQE